MASDKPVRVWSECGVTLPVGDSMAFIKFAFGHERMAKNDSEEEIQRTVNIIDEFNEKELERRIQKYSRLIQRVASEDEEEDEPPKKRKTQRSKSVKDRAKRRMDSY